MFDVVIIGGGPAGSSTAIRLAQSGLRVRLYEKTRFPRSKLCGGFLSPESLMDLESLGMLDEVRAAGALPVHRTLVSSPNGTEVAAPLPSPGLSLCRQDLDMILLQRARAVGVEVMEGMDGFTQAIDTRWTIVATGRSIPKDGKCSPRFYGIQAFFESVPDVTDQVELDLVSGGYVGLVQQTPGRVNLCALTTQQIFQDRGSNIDAILATWTQQNPTLKKRLQQARRVSSWQAVGPVQMGLRQLGEPGRLFVGDAACVVDPFAGEGIAMGLQSAALIQQAFCQNRLPIEQAYTQAWKEAFSSALRIEGWLRGSLTHRSLQNVFVQGLRLFPPLLTWLVQQTRPSLPYENLQSHPDHSAV